MHGRLSLVVVIAVAATLAICGSASAAQRYASPTGVATTVCAQVNPCGIVNALDPLQTNNGDEIILEPGTYTPSAQLYIPDDVNVHGTGAPADTLIDSSASTNGVVMLDGNGTVLSDVEIHANSGGSVLWVNHGTARRVIVRNQNAEACGGGANTTYTDVVCRSLGAGGLGLRLNWTNGTQSVKLRNVDAVAYGAGGVGISLTASSTAATTMDALSVIARGAADDVEVSQSGGGTVVATLKNSNYGAVLPSGGASVTDPTAPGNGNQTAAPVFVNQPNGDFREAANSPTINAGAVDAFSGTTDVLGNARAQGSAADIGAFEYDSTPPAAPVISAPASGAVLTTSLAAGGTAEIGSSVNLKIDGNAAGTTTADGSGNWSVTAPLALADGSHLLAVTATDANLNVSAAASVAFIVDNSAPGTPPPILPIDTIAPKITVTAKPKSKTKSRRAKIVFTSDESAQFKCKLDKSAAKACTSPFAAKKLKPGKHQLQITATDAAGNAAKTVVVKWKVTKN